MKFWGIIGLLLFGRRHQSNSFKTVRHMQRVTRRGLMPRNPYKRYVRLLKFK